MPPSRVPALLLAAFSVTAVANGRLAASPDEGSDHPGAQSLSKVDHYHHHASKDKPSSDHYFSSDKAAKEFHPSSDSYFYSSKIKGKGFNAFSAMGWLSEECPGNRTSEQKEHLLKGCARWSTGLEHESFLVHSHEESKEEYVVNVGTVATQMARYGRVFGLDRETHSVATYLEHTGVEFSGRSCAGINEVNFKGMAEAVSTDHKQLTFDSAFCQIELLDAKIIDVVSVSPGESTISESLGEIRHPRAGMSSQLGLYTRTGGKTHTCSTCNGCDLKDYTGSYHISISLPHDPEGWILYDEGSLQDSSTCAEHYVREGGNAGESPNSVWVDAHMNFANMVQWVEPLFVAVMGTSDSEAVCDSGEFIEGSYRTMSSGWGVPGTTDVVPSSDAGIFGCTDEGMGSDIRTKSSVDEHFMAPGTPLPPMDVGQGLEIRIFDNFLLKNLKTAYRVVALLAENSRVHHADEYINGDQGWKVAAQEAMKEGWNAILDADYVHSLESNLNVDLSGLGGNTQAFDVFSALYAQLIDRHSDGLWTGLLLDDIELEPVLDNPNRDSWEGAALDAEMTPSSIREALGVGGDYGMIQLADVDGDCNDDIEDLVYLADTLGMVETLETNANGSVKAVKFYPESEDESPAMRTCAST